jgi:23S rRNA-/tRNA-specific pseudouridylate synthase
MEARDLDKEYRAICHGSPLEEHGDWRDPIGDGPDETIQRAVRPDGQICHTEYFVLERAQSIEPKKVEPNATSLDNPNTFSLLRLLLHTGRQHQIRVHAAHNGCPLVGDWVYGTACGDLKGQALHAVMMEFVHPKEKRTVRIEAPFPRVLANLWAKLKAGGSLIPVGLSEEQQSKLGYVAPEETVRRPSWLTAAEFEQLRLEAGE